MRKFNCVGSRFEWVISILGCPFSCRLMSSTCSFVKSDTFKPPKKIHEKIIWLRLTMSFAVSNSGLADSCSVLKVSTILKLH